MSKDASTSIQVVTREDENTSRGLSDKIELVTSTLDIDKLKKGFAEFVTNLQSIIDTKVDATSPFQLNEIQFCAEIAASGDFKLLGTGVGIEGSSAITFILRRKKSEKEGIEGKAD